MALDLAELVLQIHKLSKFLINALCVHFLFPFKLLSRLVSHFRLHVLFNDRQLSQEIDGSGLVQSDLHWQIRAVGFVLRV